MKTANFADALENADNVAFTENGAEGYKSTGHKLLDISFQVPAFRSMNADDIAQKFIEAFYEDEKLALKWLLYLGDIRHGLGERHSFKAILNYLARNKSEIASKLVSLVPEYARWDYIFTFFGTPLETQALQCIDSQLAIDIDNLAANKSVSLLAKWLPSENASSRITKSRASIIRRYLGMTSRNYRKTLSALRKQLDVVETHMCAKDWTGINYAAVPSKANVKYNAAFLRNDAARRSKFLSAVKNGDATINSAVNFPYDIVHKYMLASNWSYDVRSNDDAGLEALWNALPAPIKSDESTIVVEDTSGSMTARVGNGKVTAWEVATSLAIYFADHLNGPFHNKVIEFSSKPSFIKLDDKMSLREKITAIADDSLVDNTNIEAVFDLILNTAISNSCTQKDLPKNILIVSDMEFDESTCTYDFTSGNNMYCAPNASLFKTIAAKFESHGYKMPKLIFWNVNSRTMTIPVKENENGVILVSGFSINTFNMVLNKETDPYVALQKTLNCKRYEVIDTLFADL